jgi:CubicO group peptidase (beta-lactamase class C family)
MRRRAFITLLGGAAVAAWGSNRAAAAAGDNPLPAVADTDPRLAAYDDLMNEFMRMHQPPGAALAVSRDGRLVYARGFGLADLERKEPVHPLSLFRIASISKPFSATAVMQLVQQGRLRLDDRVFRGAAAAAVSRSRRAARRADPCHHRAAMPAAHRRLGPRQGL